MNVPHLSPCGGERPGHDGRRAARHRPRPGSHGYGGATTQAWDWQLRARCRGLPAEVFFTTDEDRGVRRIAHEENAKRICRDCPVRAECLRHTMRADETYGIWGATTPKERAALQQSESSASRRAQ